MRTIDLCCYDGPLEDHALQCQAFHHLAKQGILPALAILQPVDLYMLPGLLLGEALSMTSRAAPNVSQPWFRSDRSASGFNEWVALCLPN